MHLPTVLGLADAFVRGVAMPVPWLLPVFTQPRRFSLLSQRIAEGRMGKLQLPAPVQGGQPFSRSAALSGHLYLSGFVLLHLLCFVLRRAS